MTARPSLRDFLDREVYPRVRSDPARAFDHAAHGWGAPRSAEWAGGCPWHESSSGKAFHLNVEKLAWNCKSCGFGGDPVSYRHRLRGGDGAPRGVEFVDVVRELAALVGGPALPERDLKPEEIEQARKDQARRSVLAAVIEITQRLLHDEKMGTSARAFLEARGLDHRAVQDLGLGYYPAADRIEQELPPPMRAAAREAGLIWPKLDGFAVFPWADETGRMLTIYGRWPARELPPKRAHAGWRSEVVSADANRIMKGRPKRGEAEPRIPKLVAAPGEGSKRSPLYFDRARKAGAKDLVAVEGLIDAALLQVRGERNVVAYVGGCFSKEQAETLARCGVRSVVLVPDPDAGGDKGAADSIRFLDGAGVRALVAPRLPDGLDPDELVLRDGVDAWRAHVARAIAGSRWRAERAVVDVTPASPEIDKTRAVEAVAEIARKLAGDHAHRERDGLVDVLHGAIGGKRATLERGVPHPAGEEREAQTRDRAAPDAEAGPYREQGGRLVWVKRTDRGDEEHTLANFTARITAEVVEDDDQEERRLLEITARVGPRTRAFTVPIAQFGTMTWPIENLGAGAILEPGHGLKDRARAAIQALSWAAGSPPERRIYTHTGWRKIDGAWVYLHAGGAIGAQGPVAGAITRLHENLARFELPAPPDGEQLREAVRASLRMLELAPPRLIVPLFAAIWRAALGGRVGHSVFVWGTTGQGKTCLAGLAQQHFGARMDRHHLPASWSSTANANEALLFLAKDALLVVDDFVLKGTSQQQARTLEAAERLIRGQANGAGRTRMRDNGGLRATRAPRGMLVATGEELPHGSSLVARAVTLQVSPGDVDFGRLSGCQADAAAGRYAEAMAGFLRWLAARYEERRGLVDAQVAEARAVFARPGLHAQTPEASGSLLVGLRTFVEFAAEVGAIDDGKADRLLADAMDALADAVEDQGAVQRHADPVHAFFHLVGVAIRSGRAHLAGTNNRLPRDPATWGWRPEREGREAEDPEADHPDGWKPPPPEVWRASGERIGWVDAENDEAWVLLDAAKKVARDLGGDEFSISAVNLGRMMKERNLLLSRETSRQTNVVRTPAKMTGDGSRPAAAHVRAGLLVGSDLPRSGSADPDLPSVSNDRADLRGGPGQVGQVLRSRSELGGRA